MTGWRILTRLVAGFALIFLIAPLLVIVPLSFNAEPFFTFTDAMLAFEPSGYSLRWYEAIFNDPVWSQAVVNSLIIGLCATAIATVLGTLAAMGLARGSVPFKGAIMGLIISPMITPIVIAAAGMYFFYSDMNLTQSHLGLILAHATLGAPFVVITVTAALTGYDWNLTRAGASLGATPVVTFFRVTLPLILPGVISGALFAFCDLVRRGGDRAVPGRAGAGDGAAQDVVGHPRADQPGDPGGGDLVDPGRDGSADLCGVAAAAGRADESERFRLIRLFDVPVCAWPYRAWLGIRSTDSTLLGTPVWRWDCAADATSGE